MKNARTQCMQNQGAESDTKWKERNQTERVCPSWLHLCEIQGQAKPIWGMGIRMDGGSLGE